MFLSDSASFFHRMSLIVPFVEFDLSHFLKLLMVSSDEAPFFAHILHFHNKPAGILNFADTVAHSGYYSFYGNCCWLDNIWGMHLQLGTHALGLNLSQSNSLFKLFSHEAFVRWGRKFSPMCFHSIKN